MATVAAGTHQKRKDNAMSKPELIEMLYLNDEIECEEFYDTILAERDSFGWFI